MNERYKTLWSEAAENTADNSWEAQTKFMERYTELVVEECRTVVCELYRNTPLEYCGVLLTADQAIAEHFYKVNK